MDSGDIAEQAEVSTAENTVVLLQNGLGDEHAEITEDQVNVDMSSEIVAWEFFREAPAEQGLESYEIRKGCDDRLLPSARAEQRNQAFRSIMSESNIRRQIELVAGVRDNKPINAWIVSHRLQDQLHVEWQLAEITADKRYSC